ncbi:MAG: glycosyltransferase [Clostridia bacterium]|nr:glycosyltransferase [Clostridia bacterium]
MEKKALQLASVASMIDQFNIPNIKILQSLGYKVDVVADFTHPGTITKERAEDLKNRLADMNVRVFDIAIPRSLNPRSISTAYKQVKELLDRENYNLLHCHSPIGGVIARQAARGKEGLKVIYTAHGFHFYDGAPLKNWLIFYPIEKHFSRYTDVLITINKEDYKRAKEKFKAKKTVYIPGVGVDTEKFVPCGSAREKIRAELGLKEDEIILLSVGELNDNKNHISVIKAIAGLNLVYVIVGKGEKKEELEKAAKECGVNLRLTGFRTDVADFYAAADIYILPSIREGLNVSLMEAMASSLPCLVGKIRGNVDLIDEHGGYLFRPESESEIRTAVENCVANRTGMGEYNLHKIRTFDINTVENLITKIYEWV